KRADSAEFIGQAKNQASRVGAIGDELGIVGQQYKFLIKALPGKVFRDYLLSLYVAFDPQVSPAVEEAAQGNAEWRVFKVRKFCSIRIGFHDQLAVNVELQMLAVRADHSFRKSNRFVAARPMECRLQNHFFRRIAL